MAIDETLQYYSKDVYGSEYYGGYEEFEEEHSANANRKRSEQWFECSRCGIVYPREQVRRQQGDSGSVIVCTVSCSDEISRGDYLAQHTPVEEKPLVFDVGEI